MDFLFRRTGMKKLLIIILALCASLPYAAAISADHVADVIGERGGLVVHVGCEDGSLAASLASNDALVVQELSTDAGTVAKLREKLQANGAYGKATIAQFDGKRLPYVESTVNLLIISDPAQLTGQEIMRVLAPNGMVLVDEGKSVPGLKTKQTDKRKNAQAAQKPWPQEIDEWTHYLHDAQGSSLSNDTVAGAPKGLRWTCGPLWARSHEHTASMNAMVSAGGRVFYVMDEGPTESVQLPAENYLTARDAFNGVELWKRPLPNWFNHLYPLKSGPGWLPRRLVAVGERVYLAPGTGEPLLCLDAATGEVLRRYQDTASTFELIVSDGIVFAAVDPNEQPVDYKQEHPNCWKERDRASKRWGWHRDRGARVIKAMDAESGDTLWQKEMPLVPMTLSADAEKVCFFDGQAILALNKTTGDELWRTAVSPMPHVYTGYAGPRLIMTDKHVVLAPKKEIFVLDAQTGDMVWSVKNKPRSGHYSLEDFFVIGDTVWALGRSNNGKFTTYNLATGDIEKQFSNPIDSFYIHQRCYPGKATKRYLLPPMMGMTTYEMDTNQWDINHWVRGGCIYGSMPANGMVYAGPHACACYYQSKLNGFNAVAPNAQSHAFQPGETRLVKGPAYGRCDTQADYPASAWPAFRHDKTRSGYVKTDVAENVAPAWDKPFNTKLSQAVAADGKVFVSAVDQHTLYALDAASGKEVWRFVAGGRVDSPPTLYKGMA
ncbi:PQQ-binding-like beta-propeller repeat protein, partial [bacterium]|nr:PQQ-binding-like beta-propeller repeat protein [bacterium]